MRRAPAALVANGDPDLKPRVGRRPTLGSMHTTATTLKGLWIPRPFQGQMSLIFTQGFPLRGQPWASNPNARWALSETL